MNFKAACVQMTSSSQIDQNLDEAARLIRQAAEQGAQLVVLPEMFATMGMDQAEKVKHYETPGKGPIQAFLSETANNHKIWIVGGTLPIRAESSEKVYASSLIFNDSGKCVSRYDKIHLFDVELPASQESYLESQTIQPGEKIIVAETPFGKLGLAVCYDVRFPEMFRLMLKEGVEILALPSAFTYTTGAAHWEILVRARAIENLSFVLAACQTGMHSNHRRTYGHSMIVNPWGDILAQLPENPGVIIAEINLDFQKRIRRDFPALTHRKLSG